MVVYCLRLSLCLPRVVSFPENTTMKQNLLENGFSLFNRGHMVEGQGKRAAFLQGCVRLIYYDLFFVHLSN